MYATIEPVVYRTGQATALVVRSTIVQLSERAYIEWTLMGESESRYKEFESGSCQMTGADYTAWSDNDEYVYTWLASQLSLTIVSINPGNLRML